MSAFFAIDAGTGYMKLAMIDVSGRPVPIEFPDGELQMSSCVYFEGGEKPVFGSEALNQGLIDPKQLGRHWKRSLGTPEVLFTTGNGTEYRARDILALLQTECRRVAETSMSKVVSRAVLTTPANVNDGVKQDILAAAQKAAIEVIKLAHEPTAALLSKTAGTDRQIADGHRGVVDVGCGTTDISIEEKRGNTHSIVATNGVGKLGGLDFTHRALEHCVSEFEKAHGIRVRQETHPEDYADL